MIALGVSRHVQRCDVMTRCRRWRHFLRRRQRADNDFDTFGWQQRRRWWHWWFARFQIPIRFRVSLRGDFFGTSGTWSVLEFPVFCWVRVRWWFPRRKKCGLFRLLAWRSVRVFWYVTLKRWRRLDRCRRCLWQRHDLFVYVTCQR